MLTDSRQAPRQLARRQDLRDLLHRRHAYARHLPRLPNRAHAPRKVCCPRRPTGLCRLRRDHPGLSLLWLRHGNRALPSKTPAPVARFGTTSPPCCASTRPGDRKRRRRNSSLIVSAVMDGCGCFGPAFGAITVRRSWPPVRRRRWLRRFCFGCQADGAGSRHGGFPWIRVPCAPPR